MAFISFVILHSKMDWETILPAITVQLYLKCGTVLHTSVLQCLTVKSFSAGNNPSFGGLSGRLNPVYEVAVCIQVFENLDKIVLRKVSFKTKLLTNSHHFSEMGLVL